MAAVNIADCELGIREHAGVRVITPDDADRLHRRAPGAFLMLFRGNKDRLTDEQEFFVDKGAVLLTENGYLALAKTFHDRRSFRVQRELVANYFHSAPTAFDEETDHEHLLLLLEFHEGRVKELRRLLRRHQPAAFPMSPKWNRRQEATDAPPISQTEAPRIDPLNAGQLRRYLLEISPQSGGLS